MDSCCFQNLFILLLMIHFPISFPFSPDGHYLTVMTCQFASYYREEFHLFLEILENTRNSFTDLPILMECFFNVVHGVRATELVDSMIIQN